MEEETCETCLDALLEFFENAKGFRASEYLRSQIEMMNLELNLLKMFFQGLAYLGGLEWDFHLRFAIKSMMQKLMHLVAELAAEYTGMSTTKNLLNLDVMKNMWAELRQILGEHVGGDKWINLDVVMYDIGKNIDEQLRPQAIDVCILLLGRTNYNCTSCPPSQKKFSEFIRDTTSLVDLIFQNLKAILNSNLIAPVMKQQIGFIQAELEKYGMSVDLAEVKQFSELISRARTWFSRISCLTYLYWSDGKDETVSSITGDIFLGFLHQNFHVSTSWLISSIFQPTMIPQLLSRHLNFFLGEFELYMKDSLQEALIFMLSFIMDPPDLVSKDRERIWEKVHVAFNKFPSLIYSIRSGEMKEEICKANISDFLIKADRIKAKVKELCVMNPYSSELTAPSTNAIGFLNSLVVNLSGTLEVGVNFIPCVEHLYKLLYLELEQLQQSFMELLQDDRYQEVNDLWKEMINMVYNVNYSTKNCFRGSFFTWWYCMVALPDAIEHTKVMRIQIKKLVRGDKLYNKKKLHYHEEIDGAATLRPIGKAFESERTIVGFIEDEKKVIDKLLRGSKSLTILSISGLGGQGKTTLAKRIYDNHNVRYVFQSRIWIYVSKDCPVKKLLVQILSRDTESGGAKLEMEDLILKVWRSLKGKRYLIVLDDIWDVGAWEQLKRSFPDDKNQSRILFTTRDHDLASKAVESNSFSHRLPLFSDEQSWELIKERVFGSNNCDEEFVRIGKKIASQCEGLPLAVVLIAGVLRRIERNMDVWSKVLENLKAHLVEEGCGNVLELSYRYLQDHLKSCFLYFAAFPRGKDVTAKKLKLLWIGEGFAVNDDLATKYLRDLVSLGLVDFVPPKSSMGRIKLCSVHDLLYDLCLEKAKEEKFMHLVEESSIECNTNPSSGLPKYSHHRLCIGKIDPSMKSIPTVIKRELQSSPVHTFLWSTKNPVSKHRSLEFLASCKILTVLKLELRLYVFPVVILSCTYLRHLELHLNKRTGHGQPKIDIPPTIATLWKLRTFIIKYDTVMTMRIPSSMWDMESLRFVDVRRCLVDKDGFDLKNSSKSNIERLGTLFVVEDHDNKIIGILRKFSNLRKLRCISEHMGPWLLSMVVSELPQLESLYIEQWSSKEPADWNFHQKMGNLTKLTLEGTRMPWSVLSEFGKQLPNLRVLKLRTHACVGTSWKLEDGDFENLKYLQIWDLDIKEIDVSTCENPLPCLEHLELVGTRIMEIPPAIGEIATLNTIKVGRHYPELETSALEILDEQIDCGNDDLQVYIIVPKIKLRVAINCSKTQVMKAVTKLEGVDQVSVDAEKGIVTVIGDVDPVCVINQVRKTGKHVELEIVSVETLHRSRKT